MQRMSLARKMILGSVAASLAAVSAPAVAVTPAQRAYCAFWRDYLTLWPFKTYAYNSCIASYEE